MDIAEAKARLPIPALWEKLDLPGSPKVSCKSPFRNDKHASFSVSKDGQLFNDFATGEAGDAVDFLQIATGLSRREACRKFIELAGGGVLEARPLAKPRNLRRIHLKLVGGIIHEPKPFAERTDAAPQPRPIPNFPDFERGNAADFRQLARLRNLSVEGLKLAGERGLLWFAELRGFAAWIVTDGEAVNAQARRMDGGTWEHLEGEPKAWTLRGSWAGWPIGAREAQSFEKLALVEGGADLLAAWHFIHCEDRERDVAPVTMLGASQHIHEDALPLFAGKRIRLFPHLDTAGQEAAERWTRQLGAVGAEVDAFSLSGLCRTNGELVGDLNDLASICPDDFETERETWAVMP